MQILRGHKTGRRDLRFSDDGSRIASASHDGQLIVWDVASGKPLVITDTFEVGWSVDFSPDGRRVYTGGDDAALRTWDLYGDQQFLRRMFAVRGGQEFIDVQASPDGRWLAVRLARLVRELGPFPRHRHGNDDAREGPR